MRAKPSRNLIETLLRLPMPFMLCAGLGLIFWRRTRLRRLQFALAALGPLVLGPPILGKLLMAAQLLTVARSVRCRAGGDLVALAAILVPTGGMYKVGDEE